jgi:hypothetical protein
MRCARALPTHPLMPATGSRKVPVATPLLGGLPGKIERPHPNPHVGHPSIIMSPDLRPWTQISSVVPVGTPAHAGKSGAVARRGRSSLARLSP